MACVNCFLALAFAFITLADCATPSKLSTPKVTEPSVKLLWADEFVPCDRTAVDCMNGLNTKDWGFELGDGSDYRIGPGWGNKEMQCYIMDDSVAGVRLKDDGSGDGALVLQANQKLNWTCENPLSNKKHVLNYTSARLTTRDKHWFVWEGNIKKSNTIVIESRIKLPFGKGLFPAFWMLPQNTTPCGMGCGEYGGWCRSGEIPIIESINTMTFGLSSLIIRADLNESKGEKCTRSSGRIDYGNSLADGFHTYTLTWNSTHMSWLIDGSAWHTDTYTSWTGMTKLGKKNPLAPYDKPFYMILNVAVGGGWPGVPTPLASVFPQSMVVDYVRVYQVECQSYETSCNDGIDNDCDGQVDVNDEDCAGYSPESASSGVAAGGWLGAGLMSWVAAVGGILGGMMLL